MSRILVVEDEAAIARALADDFRSRDTTSTWRPTVHSLREGRTNAFDLVVLDVMLPGKDGFDVCRDLRRAGIRAPILMLTAKTMRPRKCSASNWAPTTT